jgi:hypothetical protein
LIRYGRDDEIRLGRDDLLGLRRPGISNDYVRATSHLRADVGAVPGAGDQPIELADIAECKRGAGLERDHATRSVVGQCSLIIRRLLIQKIALRNSDCHVSPGRKRLFTKLAIERRGGTYHTPVPQGQHI